MYFGTLLIIEMFYAILILITLVLEHQI
jgi:hypothetical protein